MSVSVDGQATGRQHVPFEDVVNEQCVATVEADKSATIETEIGFWVQAVTEDNTHTPARYTQDFQLQFRNYTADPLNVEFSNASGAAVMLSLKPGEAKSAFTARDLRPEDVACNFRLMSP